MYLSTTDSWPSIVTAFNNLKNDFISEKRISNMAEIELNRLVWSLRIGAYFVKWGVPVIFAALISSIMRIPRMIVMILLLSVIWLSMVIYFGIILQIQMTWKIMKAKNATNATNATNYF